VAAAGARRERGRELIDAPGRATYASPLCRESDRQRSWRRMSRWADTVEKGKNEPIEIFACAHVETDSSKSNASQRPYEGHWLEIELIIFPPTSFSDHRTGASEKICSTPRKAFFNSIDQSRHFGRGFGFPLLTRPCVVSKKPHTFGFRMSSPGEYCLAPETGRRLMSSPFLPPRSHRTLSQARGFETESGCSPSCMVAIWK
jgi:hypothetical protein